MSAKFRTNVVKREDDGWAAGAMEEVVFGSGRCGCEEKFVLVLELVMAEFEMVAAWMKEANDEKEKTSFKDETMFKLKK
jgi:hypothetical protein